MGWVHSLLEAASAVAFSQWSVHMLDVLVEVWHSEDVLVVVWHGSVLPGPVVSDCETVPLPSGDTVSSVVEEVCEDVWMVADVVSAVPGVEACGEVLCSICVVFNREAVTLVITVVKEDSGFAGLLVDGSAELGTDSDGDSVVTLVTVVTEIIVPFALRLSVATVCEAVISPELGTEEETMVVLTTEEGSDVDGVTAPELPDVDAVIAVPLLSSASEVTETEDDTDSDSVTVRETEVPVALPLVDVRPGVEGVAGR